MLEGGEEIRPRVSDVIWMRETRLVQNQPGGQAKRTQLYVNRVQVKVFQPDDAVEMPLEHQRGGERRRPDHEEQFLAVPARNPPELLARRPQQRDVAQRIASRQDPGFFFFARADLSQD